MTLQPSVPFYQTCLPSIAIAGLLGAHPAQSPSGALSLSTLTETTSESCVTTDAGPAPSGTACHFPFVYPAVNGQEYWHCTDVNNGGIPWCSTQYDYLGVGSGWGNCQCTEQDSTVLNSSATWSVEAGRIQVRLRHGEHMVAGTSYTFSFDLFNDASPRTSSVEVVAASPLISVSQPMSVRSHSPLTCATHPSIKMRPTWT